MNLNPGEALNHEPHMQSPDTHEVAQRIIAEGRVAIGADDPSVLPGDPEAELAKGTLISKPAADAIIPYGGKLTREFQDTKINITATKTWNEKPD